MKQYAAVLEEALTDAAAPLDHIIPSFHLLPNGVVGMALSATRKVLPEERRKAISSWISNQEQERGDAERAYALPGLISCAPAEAFHALKSMKTSPTPNKDLRERLAWILSDISADQITGIFAEQKEHEIRKVILLLLITAQEAKADRQTRAAVIEAVIPPIAQFRLYKDSIGLEVRRQVEGLMRSLDALSIKRIRESLQEKSPDALQDLLGEPPSAVTPERAHSTGVEPTHIETRTEANRPEVVSDSSKLTEPEENQTVIGPVAPAILVVPDPLAWFDANIQMLAHAREFYLSARREAEAERIKRGEAEARAADLARTKEKLSAAEARIHDLEAERTEVMRQRDVAREALRTVTENLDQSRLSHKATEREVIEAKEEFNRERQALQRRVDINADARLNDFRLAISAALTPIIRDVPPPGFAGAAELGPGLLICIDQIVRALGEKGINFRRAVGEQL
jgi:hypothetical protein